MFFDDTWLIKIFLASRLEIIQANFSKDFPALPRTWDQRRNYFWLLAY